MIDNIVDVDCKDLTHITEIHEHSFFTHTFLINDVAFDFCFESISMAMKMTALTLVIRNSMSCIGFNISTNSCCHSFTSNRIATLLMQYLSPPCLRGPSLKTCPRCASQFPHRTSTLVIPCDVSMIRWILHRGVLYGKLASHNPNQISSGP